MSLKSACYEPSRASHLTKNLRHRQLQLIGTPEHAENLAVKPRLVVVDNKRRHRHTHRRAVKPSYKTRQEFWFIPVQEPKRDGRNYEKLDEERMRITVRDMACSHYTMTTIQYNQQEWEGLSWNFKYINRMRKLFIEPQVQGPPEILAWLVKWATGENPVIHSANAKGLLEAAIFFEGKRLIINCLAYFRKKRRDISYLRTRCLVKLARYLTSMDLERLGYVRNYKGYIFHRLYYKLALALMRRPEPHRGHLVRMSRLFKCAYCRKLIPQEKETCIPCLSLAERQQLRKRRFRRRKLSRHRADRRWTLKRYAHKLLGKFNTWRNVYWLLWSETHFLYCIKCKLLFPVQKMYNCPLAAHHRPRVATLEDHINYKIFCKNFQLILDLYRLKHSTLTEDKKVAVRPIMDIPRLGYKVHYRRKSKRTYKRYIGSGHNWQNNRRLRVNRANQILYERHVNVRINRFLTRLYMLRKGLRPRRIKVVVSAPRRRWRKRWVPQPGRGEGIFMKIMRDWCRKYRIRRKRLPKIYRPKFTFTAAPINPLTQCSYIGPPSPRPFADSVPWGWRNGTELYDKAAEAYRPWYPNLDSAAKIRLRKILMKRPYLGGVLKRNQVLKRNKLCADDSRTTGQNKGHYNLRLIPVAIKRPNLHAGASPNKSSAVRPCTSHLNKTLMKRPNLSGTNHLNKCSEAHPSTQHLKTKVMKRTSFGAGKYGRKNSAGRRCSDRPKTMVIKHPNSPVRPCTLRRNTSDGTNRPRLGTRERQRKYLAALPCTLRLKRIKSNRSSLNEGYLLKKRSVARPYIQSYHTGLMQYSKLGADKQPNKLSTVHPCTQGPNRRMQDRPNSGAVKHPNKYLDARPRTQYLNVIPPTSSILDVCEHPSKPSSPSSYLQDPQTRVMKRPNLGAVTPQNKCLVTSPYLQHPQTRVTQRSNTGAVTHLNKELVTSPYRQHPQTMVPQHPNLGTVKHPNKYLDARPRGQYLNVITPTSSILDVCEHPSKPSSPSPYLQHPQTRVMKGPNLGAVTPRNKCLVTSPYLQRPPTRVPQHPRLGAGEHSNKRLVTSPYLQRPQTRVLQRPNLGAVTDPNKSSAVLPCTQHSKTKEMNRPLFGAGEHPSTNSAVHLSTKHLTSGVMKHPNLGAGEHPSACSTVLPCNQRLKTSDFAKHPWLDANKYATTPRNYKNPAENSKRSMMKRPGVYASENRDRSTAKLVSLYYGIN